MYDNWIFDIANTFVYITLLLTIYFHAVGRVKFYPFLLLLTNWFLFLCVPAFGQIFLWLTGACAYLWGTVFVLLYLIPYRIQYGKEEEVLSSKIVGILFGVLGIIVCNYVENVSLGLVAVILAFMLSSWHSYRRVYFWCLCGLIGACVGVIVTIAAPGNFVRWDASGFELDIVHNFIIITASFLNYHYLSLPLLAALIFSILCKDFTDYRLAAIYFLGLLVSAYAMIASPYMPDRTKLGALVFAIIFCNYFYSNIEFDSIRIKKLLAVFVVLIICVNISEYKLAGSSIRHFRLRHEANIAHVLEEKAHGNLDVVVLPNPPESRYVGAYGLEDINKNVNRWINIDFAKYYGLKTVRTE